VRYQSATEVILENKVDGVIDDDSNGLVAGMKVVRIFFDRIRNQIRIEGFRYVRIRVRIFNIRYCIRIRILKSHIYDVDIQMYPIRHG
jgi:hypothetical protein